MDLKDRKRVENEAEKVSKKTARQPDSLTTIDDFVMLEKLGDGAYSKVFKVQRVADQQIYAMKKVKIGQMATKDRDNAVNEVRILASICHPNVI